MGTSKNTPATRKAPAKGATRKAPAPAPATTSEGAEVTTRDGLAVDPHPVTPEDLATVKARRHTAADHAVTGKA